MNNCEFYQPVTMNLNRFPDIKGDDTLFLKPSISSGVNWLNPPQMYTDLFIKEINCNHIVKNYTNSHGYPILVNSIKYYESKKYGNELSYINHDLCITAGGTSAIVFIFQYIFLNNKNNILLFLGLSYYMFYVCAERMNLTHYTLVSEIKGRILPSVDEMLEYIKIKKIDYIFLTLPQNPSSEIYNDNEFGRLIEELNYRNCNLIIDICQMDEFNSKNQYVNYNRIGKP